MNALAQRVRRLEEKAGAGSGRLFVVHSHGSTDGEVQAALADAGAIVGPRDRVLHFRTIYEDRDGNAIPMGTPPILSPPVPLALRSSRV